MEYGVRNARPLMPRGTAHVLCVGSIALDHVVAVDTALTVGAKHVGRSHGDIGGGVAANAAVAVARLGGRSTLLGCVGADRAGGRVLDELIREHVDVRGVQRLGSETTAESIVIVEPDGARTIVAHSSIDLGEVAPPPADLFDHVDDLAAVLVDGRWPAASLTALRCARRRAVPGIVDVDRLPADEGFRGALFAAASHLVFSEVALRALTGIDDPADALQSVRCQTAAHLSVTLGERGVVWIDGEQSVHLPAFAVSAVDTTGAGDVFHGALALALAEGVDERRGFEFAAAAAAIKCSRPGARAGTPHLGDVLRFLDERRMVPHR